MIKQIWNFFGTGNENVSMSEYRKQLQNFTGQVFPKIQSILIGKGMINESHL